MLMAHRELPILLTMLCCLLPSCDDRSSALRSKRHNGGPANSASSGPATEHRVRFVEIEGTRGVVLPLECGKGENCANNWSPTNEVIAEFERNLLQDLRRRNVEFGLSGKKFPRRYSGKIQDGDAHLMVAFCYPELGWDEFPVVSSSSPCKFLMKFKSSVRAYLGPIRLLDSGGWDNKDMGDLQ
jgi:hypothetical protein